MLSEGDFNIAAAVSLNGLTEAVMEGSGWGTNIVAPSSGTLSRMLTVGASGSVATRCAVRHLKLTGDTGLTGTADGLDVGSGGNFAVDCELERVYATGIKSSAIAVYADGTKIIRCYSIDNGVCLYTSGADDVVILGGKYKDTKNTSTGEVMYINGGDRVKLLFAHLEQTTNNGEALDWRAIDGLIMGATIKLGALSGNNGAIINAAATVGKWIGGRVEHAGYSGTPGAGIQLNAPDWSLVGISFAWDVNAACILLQTSAAHIAIAECIAESGTWFVHCNDIAGGVRLLGNIARGANITDAVRVETSTVNFSGLYARGNTFSGLGGYAYRVVEGGAPTKTVSNWDTDDLDLSGNSGGTFVGSATGSDIWRRATVGYKTKNDVLSGTFDIASTGIKTVTIAHGLDVTPTAQQCAVRVIEDTNVDDWAYDLLKVESTDATNVVVKINVSTASATGGATAKIGLSMDASKRA